MLRAEQLHEKVLSRMDFMREPSDEELLEIIHSVLEESSKKQFIPLKEKAALGKELFNAFRKLDILQELIEDESITEIMINGNNHDLKKNCICFKFFKHFFNAFFSSWDVIMSRMNHI